jgi:hypothetical protein
MSFKGIWYASISAIFTAVWIDEVLLNIFRKGIIFLAWKLSTLTWITTTATMIYFILSYYDIKIRLLRPTTKTLAYLFCISLTGIVVLAYWGLYFIDPSLVDTYNYTAYDFAFAVNLFIHGFNLLIMIIEGFNIEEPTDIALKYWTLIEILFAIWYSSITWLSHKITGFHVYGFLHAMSTSQICIFYIGLGFLSLSVKQLTAYMISYRLRTRERSGKLE